VDSLCRIERVSRFRTPLSPLRQQFRDADEGVADQIEQEAGGDSSEPPIFRLAHGAMLRAPSKHALDHFAFALREAVALVPGGPSVDGRRACLSGLRDICVDGDARGDVLCPQARHVFRNIIGLVRANRDAGMWRSSALSHCSGGIDGRPVVEYSVRKSWSRSRNTSRTSSRMVRSGCCVGTRCSGEIYENSSP
jgi:hypothetical protein